ncbi:MAG TPA: (Fe-S)-binding protein [Phototrophicaceae bacterium]|nr:(Fe-S)-binding protein [Phototrophicaceae bacterium]
MLTPVEQMLFILLTLFALGSTYVGFKEMWDIINRGQRELYLDRLPQRAWNALWLYVSQQRTLKTRRVISLFHLAVVWGFTWYFLVNLADLVHGFVPNYEFLADAGILGVAYRLVGDVLSVGVLVGVVYLMIRRFYLPSRQQLTFHDNVTLHPKVKQGAIRRDSLIVSWFILFHVGSRFLGQSVDVAATAPDWSRPFATLISPLWAGLGANGLLVLEHVFWWTALGAILIFLPYFPLSKHAHLFMAPFNFLTRPRRTSLGEMEKVDFEDETREQFGAHKLEDLDQKFLVDAFACIMCNRCQDVCPAYTTGKELSPSALEVNKRFMIKDQMSEFAAGAPSINPLMNFAISESAVWACTSCGACIDICPVGNEPMFDILDIRRDQVLVQSEFPQELQGAFNGMERQGNPWQNPRQDRFRWANGIEVPTVAENPDFDLLYWVGCAPSYDPRAQLTARAFVKVMQTAGVNFAVLGELESCTGDAARRAGNEYLYQEMASANVETINEVFGARKRRIVTTCPHCLHNLGKEYHQFGGDYEVVHHTQLIDELIEAGKLPKSVRAQKQSNVTFHDPCYLGRHNGVIDAPRDVIDSTGLNLVEMARSGSNSFCCGAGGAQFWKEEEHGDAAVNVTRYQEAAATGAEVVAVGCPFCMQMFETAKSTVGGQLVVKDVAELIAERLPETASGD